MTVKPRLIVALALGFVCLLVGFALLGGGEDQPFAGKIIIAASIVAIVCALIDYFVVTRRRR